MSSPVLLVCALSLLAASCSQTTNAPEPRSLQRPESMVFSCHGDLRITGGDGADASDPVVRSPQPVASCAARAQGVIPEGQETIEGTPELQPPTMLGFALQGSTGTVAVVRVPVETRGVSVDDADILTPGKNAIPIGTEPVALATDPSGCYVMSANAGSCDLSVIDVDTAQDVTVPARVTRRRITNAAGEVLLGRPGDMAGQPSLSEIGLACPDQPEGLLYIAYPSCNTVAVVDSATGQAVAGIRFNADGTSEITDGNIECAAQCGAPLGGADRTILPGDMIDAGPDAGMEPDAGPDAGAEPDAGVPPMDDGAARPVTLDLDAAGDRLYIGADNSASIIIVDLDEQGLPTTLSRVWLEGDIGIRKLSVSPEMVLGGFDGDPQAGSGGAFRFVYAIATDGTIRVADVLDLNTECDTQVDPRFLNDVRNTRFLGCMPVGGADTPPRRAGARSPGIELPGQNLPLDVAFAFVGCRELPDGNDVSGNTCSLEQPAPGILLGWFAYVSSSLGSVYIVNVDDRIYPDFEQSADPLAVAMPLAIAHQLRDAVGARDRISQTAVGADEQSSPVCTFPTPDPGQLGPRIDAPVLRTSSEAFVAPPLQPQLPSLRALTCTSMSGDQTVTTAVPELSYMAPVEVRESAFPDWAALPNDEVWFLTWEGPVSADSGVTAVDGPPVRLGTVDVASDGMALVDGGGPFCRMGARPHDIVILAGCDPAQGDQQCGVGETCYLHPESALSGGLCLPTSRVDALSSTCRDVLVSRRRYSVVEAHKNRLELAERRRVLRTTPIDGCTDDAQCQVLADIERELLPEDQRPAGEHTFSCEPDPTRSPGIDRCVMTCDSDEACEDGFACSGGYCVEGVVPPAECLAAVQRYQLRVGEAFSVVGERTGFVEERIVDPDTGLCVDDPDAHPLEVARIPLRGVEPCVDDGLTALSPNPCLTTVDHTEVREVFRGDECLPSEPRQFETVELSGVPAIRFKNRAFTTHLVNLEVTGDATCPGDRGGDEPPHPIVHPGFSIQFRIVAGILPARVTGEPTYPVGLTLGPLGAMWILDAGDADDNVTRRNGRIFRFPPDLSGPTFSIEDGQ